MNLMERSPQRNTQLIQLCEDVPHQKEKRSSDELNDGEDTSRTLNYKKPCTRKSPPICYICRNTCINENVTCTECQLDMHLLCVGMSKTFYDYFIVKLRKPYDCPTCSTKTITAMKLRSSEFQTQLDKLQTDVSNFHSKIAVHDSQIASMSTQMTILARAVAETSDMNDHKINSLSSRIDTQDEKLAIEMCFMQGMQKMDELLISGVPFNNQEDLKRIIMRIASHLSISLKSDDITKTHRLLSKTSDSDVMTSQFRNEPPILVKFATTDLRNSVNDCYISFLKEKKPLNLSNIGLPGQDRIYINAHLPQCLSEVYKAASQMKKDRKIQAFQAKTTCVAIKLGDTWHKIKTMRQLKSIVN